MSFDMSPASPERAQASAGVSLFTEEMGRAICARLAAGESLRRIAAGAGWPSAQTVYKWVQQRPDFAEAFWAAQKAARLASRLRNAEREAGRRAARAAVLARRPWQSGPATLYCEGLAETLCRRLMEGETLIAICREPDMPAFSTVYDWLKRYPAFQAAYAAARGVAADWLFEEAVEVARAATPGTVWADRLHFDAAKWAATRLAPRKYDTAAVAAQAVAEIRAEASGQGPLIIIRKHYSEVTPEEEARAAEGEP